TRPLFLWTSFTAPHPPLVPLMRDLYIYERDEMPKPHIGDWAEKELDYHEVNRMHYGGKEVTDKQLDLAYRAFFALVTQVDRHINRMIGTLFEQNMLDNTWIVFSSDHGDSLGDHHIWQKSNFLRGSTNVPLIITPPFKSEEAKVCSHRKSTRSLASLDDLLPTFLDIAGAPIPNQTTGKSLLDIVRDKKESIKPFQFGVCGPEGDRTYMVT